MKRIRGFVNQYTIASLMVIFGVILLSSCDSVDEENINQLLLAEETDEATPTPTETAGQVPADIPAVGLEAVTFTIDATNNEAWAYFSFASGDIVEVEDALNSEAWDIGFQRTQVKLNGGISGPGMGSVVMLSETTFEAVTVAPADGYLAEKTHSQSSHKVKRAGTSTRVPPHTGYFLWKIGCSS